MRHIQNGLSSAEGAESKALASVEDDLDGRTAASQRTQTLNILKPCTHEALWLARDHHAQTRKRRCSPSYGLGPGLEAQGLGFRGLGFGASLQALHSNRQPEL